MLSEQIDFEIGKDYALAEYIENASIKKKMSPYAVADVTKYDIKQAAVQTFAKNSLNICGHFILQFLKFHFF